MATNDYIRTNIVPDDDDRLSLGTSTLRYKDVRARDATVDRTVTLSGTTTVSGAATLSGATTISGATTLSGTTTVSGATSFTAATNGLRDGFETTTAATDTITTAESGKVFWCTASSGTQVFTLPATVAGLRYTFVCGHADGEIRLSPNAADKITGIGIALADDTDLKNTAATNAVGDAVEIVGDGADGWVITNIIGTWASV